VNDINAVLGAIALVVTAAAAWWIWRRREAVRRR
jgi:hypothetical protein